MNMLVTPVLQERRDKWFTELGNRVNKLEKEGKVKYDDLQKDDVFIDISIKATEVALKTHQSEKLDALRNALINTSLNYPPINLSMKHIFINYIDVFTIWHIKLLKFFTNPEEYSKDFPHQNNWYKALIEHSFPDLKGQEEFYVSICKDLYVKNLISLESISTSMTKQGLLTKRITSLGSQFVQFIEEHNI